VRPYRLALRNVLGNLFRSGAIVLCAALVVGLGITATLITRGAEDALRRNLSRMGADLIVIPWGTMSQDFDGAHLVGMMTRRWMPRAYMDRVSAVQGVESVSPQLYLTSVVDSPFCAHPEMHVVAYDPATDFVLAPWLERDPIGALRLGEAVAGAAISAPDGARGIHLYGYPLRLVRTLPEMGSDVDQTLFVSFETALALHEHVQAQPRPAFEIMPESISTAMVKVRLGSDPHQVAVAILEQAPGVVPIESAGFFQTQRTQVVGLLRTVLILAALIWALAILFMGMVFSLAANERRREIAILRALGANVPTVLRTLLWEGVALALAGGGVGIVVAIGSVTLLGEPLARALGIRIALPAPAPLVGLLAAGLALAVLSVALAAWIPTSRLSRQEPALTMRE